MPLPKNIKFYIKYLLGPLLFLWLVFSLYQQVRGQSHLAASWAHIKGGFSSPRIVYLLILVLLMPVNWGLEAAKWRLSVLPVHPVSFWQAYKAVLSGVSFSVTMPNRIGEYLGRILYLPDGKRLKVISLTLIGGLSQLLVTLAAGTAGFLILKERLLAAGLLTLISYQFAFFGLLVGTVLLAIFYFEVGVLERIAEKWMRNSKYLYLIESIKVFGMQRLGQLLLLSGVRYGIFLLQYILAFHFFNVEVTLLQGIWVMSLVFLALAVIPSIVLLEVGIRGQVSLVLLGIFTANSLGVLFSSVTIWAINLMLPAIVGSLFILGMNLFKRRHDKA